MIKTKKPVALNFHRKILSSPASFLLLKDIFSLPPYILRSSLIAQLVKNPPAMQETLVRFLGQEDLLERDRLPTPVFLGFPCDSDGKEFACNAGDPGPIPGLGRFPEEVKGYTLQYSGLENSMDCIVHGVTKSPT